MYFGTLIPVKIVKELEKNMILKKRLLLDIKENIHRNLKVIAAERGITLNELLLIEIENLIEQDNRAKLRNK